MGSGQDRLQKKQEVNFLNDVFVHYLFKIYVLFHFVCISNLFEWKCIYFMFLMLKKPKKGIEPPGTEVKLIVRHHVDAGS